MSSPALPSLAREAFHAARERRYPLARLAYPILLGPHWRYALLAWGYVKTLDDLVDEEESAQRSLEVLKLQSDLIERTYAGVPPGPGLSPTETYGVAFFRWDRDCGSPLRASIETVLRTMEFDIRRRGRPSPGAELDAYVVEMGGALFDLLVHFAAPGVHFAPALRETVSRAYLYADTLMDLEHDLAFGLVNVPLEDLDAYGIDPAAPPPAALRRWTAERVPDVERHFERAFAQLARLPITTRTWGRFLLAHKRERFHLFLAERGIDYLEASGRA